MNKETSEDVEIVSAQTPSTTKEPEPPVNGKPSSVRTATEGQFRKAHRKTSTEHAGLFRRLAK